MAEDVEMSSRGYKGATMALKNKHGIKILGDVKSPKRKYIQGDCLNPLEEKIAAALRAAAKAAREAAKAVRAEQLKKSAEKREEELATSIKNAKKIMGLIAPWAIEYPEKSSEEELIEAYSELGDLVTDVEVKSMPVTKKAISNNSEDELFKSLLKETKNKPSLPSHTDILKDIINETGNKILKEIKFGYYKHCYNSQDDFSSFIELGTLLRIFSIKIDNIYFQNLENRYYFTGLSVPVTKTSTALGHEVNNEKIAKINTAIKESLNLKIEFSDSYSGGDFTIRGDLKIIFTPSEAIDYIYKNINNFTRTEIMSSPVFEIINHITNGCAYAIQTPEDFWNAISTKKIINKIADGFQTSVMARWFYGACGINIPNIDPKAFYILEEVLIKELHDFSNYLDSESVYGFGIKLIEKLWYKTGVGANISLYKFLIRKGIEAIDSHKRLDGYGGSAWYQDLIDYAGKYSLTDIKYLLKGKRRFNQFKKMYTIDTTDHGDVYSIIDATLSNRAFIRIGKLSYRTAFVVLHATFIAKDGSPKYLGSYDSENDRYKTPGINYWTNGLVATVGHTRLDFSLVNLPNYKKLGYCPIQYQWWEVFNMKAPQLLENFSPLNLTYKAIKALNKVKDNFNVENINGYAFAVEVLRYAIFENPQALSQFDKKLNAMGWDTVAIQNTFATNATLKFESGDNKILAIALNRFPELFEESFSKIIAVVKKEFNGIVPKSIKLLKTYIDMYVYENVEYLEVAKEAAARNLPEEDFHRYENLWSKALKTKTHETIPGFKYEDGSYSFEKIDALDPVGMFVGLDTDCCQHLGSAGASCCKHGTRNPNSSFYVIKKKGQVIVQSWVWRSGDIIVLDSIEAKSGVKLERIISLINKLPELVIGKLGVKEIRIGKTSYGITKKVIDELDLPKASSHVKLKGYNDYMDGDKQVVLYPLRKEV